MERDEITRSALLEPARFSEDSLLLREAQVLGPGLLDGLKQGAGKSFEDFRAFEASLREDPGNTLVKFVQDHWSEAAVGAAITFVSPRKWANALLMAGSMRGVALATVDGALSAANPRGDLQSVRQRYAANIAEETHALVNALPMTIAGGALGRSAANTVFGKNMGAWDLAARKITTTDVKANLWKAHDSIFPPKAKVAVFDLDGTMVSTARHLSHGIENGSKHIAGVTGMSQEAVTKALGEQFGKLQSFTNPWTVEAAFGERLNVGKPGGMTAEQFRSTVSDPYWRIFHESIPEHLKVYEGVIPTLDALRNQGLKVVMLTNSPEAPATMRTASNGLSHQFDRMYSLKSQTPPEGLAPELLAHGSERLAAMLEMRSPELRTIPRHLRKPDPTVMNSIGRSYDARPQQVMMIGDSLADDMVLAQRSGVRGLWARYSEIDKPYDAMLDKVTGGNYGVGKPKTIPPFEAELHSFSDVLNHLRPPRDWNYVKGLPELGAWHLPLATYGLTGGQRDLTLRLPGLR